MPVTSYTKKTIDKALAMRLDWAEATAHIRFLTDFVGGQPAAEKDIEAFVVHHLEIKEPTEVKKVVARILGEEVRRTDAESDELEEKETYGLNVIRRNDKGVAWIGTWQVRAMLKASASRLEVFTKKRGSKGDMAELMVVSPSGPSKDGHLQHILILDKAGKPFNQRVYRKFMGNVQTPKGRMSIVHDSEIAPAGCEAHFKIRWPLTKVKVKDMLAIVGAAQNIALGSVKALEHGRFEIVSFEVDTPK